MILTSRTVRAKVSYGAPFARTPLVDTATNATIESARGNATKFQFGFFDTADEPLDLSEVDSLNLKIQPAQTPGGSVLADKTLAAEDLDLAMTAETWADGTAQHAEFSLTNAEMNIDPQGPKRTVWAVITAIMAGGEEVTLGAGAFVIHEDNNTAADPPPENPGTAITLEQADARYLTQEAADELYQPGASAPVNQRLTVSGTFHSGYTFPELVGGYSGGTAYWSADGSFAPGDVAVHGTPGDWHLTGADALHQSWTSDEEVDHPSDVTTWTPQGDTTGTPTIAQSQAATPGRRGSFAVRYDGFYAVIHMAGTVPIWAIMPDIFEPITI